MLMQIVLIFLKVKCIRRCTEGVDAHINPDGTTSVMLQDGMEYDAENHQVNLDNHWVNEVTPDSMNVTPDGEVQIASPEGTEFYDDGSFNIPAEDAKLHERAFS